jgi:Zn-dependent oligopeptidase
MMETMMWHPDVIRSLSQSAIPASVCDAIADQGKVLAATESMRSLALSALDLELHSIPANSDNCDFSASLSQFVRSMGPGLVARMP